MSGRPEHQNPPEIFYNDDEAAKYASNSRMIDVQTRMAERAVELIMLPEQPCLVLDVGCGSGISGEVLTELGHQWVGTDISPSMLSCAVDRETDGDLILADMGAQMRFRPGIFDGVISISALQWLCNCDRKGHEPFARLRCFFQWLYNCMRKGARAALQFYPETAGQVEMITAAAIRCGFGGGLVVDYPHSTKSKKTFLVIYAGLSGDMPRAALPQGIQGDDDDAMGSETIAFSRRERQSRKKVKGGKSKKDAIMKKKAHQRMKGFDVRKDTKYTARPRKPKAI